MSIRSPTRRCVEAATPVGIIWKKIDTENKLLTWRTVISYLLVQSSKIHSYFADRESNHKIAMSEQARKRTGEGRLGEEEVVRTTMMTKSEKPRSHALNWK